MKKTENLAEAKNILISYLHMQLAETEKEIHNCVERSKIDFLKYYQSWVGFHARQEIKKKMLLELMNNYQNEAESNDNILKLIDADIQHFTKQLLESNPVCSGNYENMMLETYKFQSYREILRLLQMVKCGLI